MEEQIRNFVIIAHVDHGKSTLADRFLEITGTVEKRLMKPQYLDQLPLERERGITIKMAPVRMVYHAHRGITQTDTRNNAESKLLHEKATYKIRGAAFEVRKNLGLGHKEIVYQKALAEEFTKCGLHFEKEKVIAVHYGDKKIGTYQPDFLVEDKVLVELKALPSYGRAEEEQLWSYLKGSPYRVALLINFGSRELEIKRVVYDTARFPRDSASSPRKSAEVQPYVLNLIDTPGHSDFSYEVSRALAAVEGAILLVDATQGIQAQTLANLEAARRARLMVIGAVNKIDAAGGEEVKRAVSELGELLGVPEKEILLVSGKTGVGVEDALRAVVARVPCPSSREDHAPHRSYPRALVFDSLYDDHKGIIAFVRLVGGTFRAGDDVVFLGTGARSRIKEVGYFTPQLAASEALAAGEIGYLATGIKDPDKLAIGDTVVRDAPESFARQAELMLPGYREPKPVVFVSLYPDDASRFDEFKQGLGRLRLTDSSLTFEPEVSEVFGRGFKGGFLGRLHFEITVERLAREFRVSTVHSFPSVAYRVRLHPAKAASADDGWRTVTSPRDFPDERAETLEPVTHVEILAPSSYLGAILRLKEPFRLSAIETRTIGEKVIVAAKLPLADLIRDFDETLKAASRGFASLGYELAGWEPADAEKMVVHLAGNDVPGLTRILPRGDIEREARVTVDKLKHLLPREQFPQAVQAIVRGRVVARETIPALRKDVTGYLYGGDRTRKMKLWKKQQAGKKKLKERATAGPVKIPASVFKELLKK